MLGVSFAFGASDCRGTRPINLDGGSARSFEHHRLHQRALVGAGVFRRFATGLYVLGLIVILLALANGSRTLSASVLVLAGTMGDIRVARTGASKISAKLGGLRRTLRWVGWQTIVLAFVLLDIAGLGFTLVAPVWLASWMTINVAALMIGALSWSEDRRLQRESAIARERVRAAERRNLEERQREAQRQQEAERLRQAEQLREAERRRRREEEEREAQRQQQAERLRQAEQLREAERRRRQEEIEREAQRQRQREREQSTTQSKTEWWSVLEVTPTANKDEIVRNYRRKIQQCHPDRVAGLSPEFLPLAEEITKALNVAYEQAIRACR